MNSMRWRCATICLSVALLVTWGCSDPEPSPQVNDTEKAATERFLQEVALAEVHLKHGDHAEAKEVINSALTDSTVADKSAAIELLDRIMTDEEKVSAGRADDQLLRKSAGQGSSTENAGVSPGKTASVKSPTVAAAEPDEAMTVRSSKSAVVPKGKTETDQSPRKDSGVAAKAQAFFRLSSKTGDPGATANRELGATPTATHFDSGRDVIAALRFVETGQEGLRLIEGFLARPNLSDSDKKVLAVHHQTFTKRAEKKLVRNGTRWLSEADGKQRRKEADQLIRQAVELLRVRDYSGARDLFVQASRTDQNGIAASFVLGLLESPVFFNSPREAETHFETVLKRDPGHVSAMNNLALTRVRLRRVASAVALWRNVAKVSPRTPQVSQNLGRLITEATAKPKRIKATTSEIRKARALYTELTGSGKGRPSDPKVGWLYMPLTLSGREKKRAVDRPDDAAVVHVALGSGFVVAPGVVLTNRQVVRDSDVVRIVDPSDRKTEIAAKVLAISSGSDLALVKCDALKAGPVRIATKLPRRSSGILVLGFPVANVFGQNLKATKGAVTALPDSAHGNMLLYDAVTNRGNSGGPVCDARAAVIAVHTAGINFAGKYGAGVPAATAAAFLREQGIDIQEIAVDAETKSWPDVDAAVSKSTVLINIYKREVRLGLMAKKDYKFNYLEDVFCNTCAGKSFVQCRVRKCVKGHTSVTRSVVDAVVNGQKIFRNKVFKVPCTTCRGKGKLTCGQCLLGYDSRLRSVGG